MIMCFKYPCFHKICGNYYYIHIYNVSKYINTLFWMSMTSTLRLPCFTRVQTAANYQQTILHVYGVLPYLYIPPGEKLNAILRLYHKSKRSYTKRRHFSLWLLFERGKTPSLWCWLDNFAASSEQYLPWDG